jgi:hypothetical protein
MIESSLKKLLFRGFSIYLIFGLSLVSLEKSFFAHACCDAEPKAEIIIESTGKIYTAVLTPPYFTRLINNILIEIYNERLVLLLARRDHSNESYKTLWQIELEEKSSDFYELFVSDLGCVVLKSESTNYLAPDTFIQLINQKGEKIKSYSKKEIDSIAKIESNQIMRNDSYGYFLNELFIFHYNKLKYKINCQDGKLTLIEGY